MSKQQTGTALNRATSPRGLRRAPLPSSGVRLALFGAVVVGAFATFTLAGGPDTHDIRDTVAEAGAGAPLAFLALYAVLTVIGFPGAVPSAASGFLFGTAFGTALTVVGATIGATAAFFIARGLGRAQVERLAGERMGRLDTWLERRGFVAVLWLRLFPLVPFNVLNYAAGLTGVRAKEYVAATAIGIMPGAFAYTALGGSISDPTSPEFVVAVGLIVVLAIAGGVLARRGRSHVRPA